MATTTPTIDLAAKVGNTVDAGPSNNDQYEPKTIALGDGRFVLIWTDNSDAAPGDSDGVDILAQVYDAFGNALGGATRINDGWYFDDEENFSVALLSTGKFVIAYEDNDVDGASIRSTVVTVASNNSMTFANHNILTDPGTDILGSPAVTAFSDGSYMVVYSNSAASTSTNAYGKVVSSGGTVGSQFAVLTGSDDVGNASNGAATLTNGNVVTVHAHRVSPDGDYGIFMRILSPTGSSVLAATEVAGTSGDSDTDTQPAVAALSGGGFVVVWTNADVNDDDILFQVYDSSGAEVGTVTAVDSAGSTENYNEPTVIGLKDGGFIVAYDDDGTDEIRAHRYDASGNSVGSSFTVASTAATESAPHLALTDDGRVIISWLANTGGNNDSMIAIYDPREATIDGDNNANYILGRLDDNSVINGLGGDDSLYGRNGADLINAGSGNDYVSGGAGNDDIRGDAGVDTISGGAGDDLMRGHDGNDRLYGDDGKDTILGGYGNDLVEGRNGDDFLKGDPGNDWLLGGEGNDSIQGGDDNDVLRGENGNDVLFGDNGQDTVEGAAGTDELRGGAGNDSLSGGDDGDLLFGWGEDDLLLGDAGNDFMKGDEGNDTLDGGAGVDSLQGNAGLDVYRFSPDGAIDYVGGFAGGAGASDQIELIGYGAAFDTYAEVMAAATQSGTRVIIDFGGGDQIHLLSTQLSSLNADDFLFG
ncbi:MAG: hypothetical protein H6848_00585 [Caulobacterales bacterium]|nr:hypothetical protein [Caulobacterales bacterium]